MDQADGHRPLADCGRDALDRSGADIADREDPGTAGLQEIWGMAVVLCESPVLDVSPGEQRLFIAAGKGGHQRSVPVSRRFFITLSGYLATERPQTDVDQVFVVLKGSRRGLPLSASGLDEIVDGARRRAGIVQLTGHQLRHTCLTRLREAGMALEAVQAQAGHRSIESTRIYLHLANAWLVEEYTRAVDAIEADLTAPDANAPRER